MTETSLAGRPIAEPGAGIGARGRLPSFGRSMAEGRLLPILTIFAAIIAVWYLGAAWLNAQFAIDTARRAGTELPFADLVAQTMSQQRPVLPAPHQVAVELWNSTVGLSPSSPRSLLYHAGVTLSSTLLGFVLGTLLGIVLAVGIVVSRVLDRSLMPWIITSQTIPILAIAPMIIVIFASQGITGLLPKAFISMYLSFFPVAVGMVKGLRSPDAMLLDLMRTYSGSRWQTLTKLRLPAAMPFLLASMKVGVAASLVGAIVGELPTGAQAGLGARLLAGSYYGQTVQIWSALVMASVLAGLLVLAIDVASRTVNRRMGMQA